MRLCSGITTAFGILEDAFVKGGTLIWHWECLGVALDGF